LIERWHLPVAKPGQVVGLLGGSFDPPHAGHVHITLEAIKRFGLDRVWWLVSPGNPLKPAAPAALGTRLAAARAMITHPRVCVTDIEARIGTVYTAATLRALIGLYPGVRFVWLMGADNLTEFDHWTDWRWIMENIAVGVFARPGLRLNARMSNTARRYARYRIPARAAVTLGRCQPPCWTFANIPMTGISSTEIRARGGWRRDADD